MKRFITFLCFIIDKHLKMVTTLRKHKILPLKILYKMLS